MNNIALSVVNEGATYAMRCDVFKVGGDKVFRGYITRLVKAEARRQYHAFGVHTSEDEVNMAVDQVIDHHQAAEDVEKTYGSNVDIDIATLG